MSDPHHLSVSIASFAVDVLSWISKQSKGAIGLSQEAGEPCNVLFIHSLSHSFNMCYYCIFCRLQGSIYKGTVPDFLFKEIVSCCLCYGVFVHYMKIHCCDWFNKELNGQ